MAGDREKSIYEQFCDLTYNRNKPPEKYAVCAICDQHPPVDCWRFVEVCVDARIMQVVVCNWCAQLVKETFKN